jgi:3-dehydrotetronate 4-kinase
MTMHLGAIADDFTGATDLASILAREGMRVVLSIGLPSPLMTMKDADAVVVALKSRTIPASEAVTQSLAALDWLKSYGARQIFFKYCSTFDSTPDGNIGPVADALSDALGAKAVIVCPAFPANGRTVFNGHLFVGRQLLQDSPMKDHPLTPMRRSDLVDLMAEQATKNVGLIPHDVVRSGAEAIGAALADHGAHYLVVDAASEADLRAIGRAAAAHRLITGGSAVAMGLPANFGIARKNKVNGRSTESTGIRTAILAGSCSAATRQQLARARTLWPSLQIDVNAIAEGQNVVGEAITWARGQNAATPVVIFGSADPAEVEANQKRYGREKAGAMMEQALANIARQLADDGVKRFLVAGGETSGAVVSSLGIQGLAIGEEIAPGVPWTSKLGEPSLKLALKSGNFGGPDFFERALEIEA